MSVYPSFPVSPDPGDLFPVSPDPGESQFVYLSDQVGWVSKTIALQDVQTGYPIWPGRLSTVLNVTGGGGGGSGGGSGGGG